MTLTESINKLHLASEIHLFEKSHGSINLIEKCTSSKPKPKYKGKKKKAREKNCLLRKIACQKENASSVDKRVIGKKHCAKIVKSGMGILLVIEVCLV